MPCRLQGPSVCVFDLLERRTRLRIDNDTKDMLVVGGFKVFSVEVEDKLKAHPDVGESAVVGAPDKARPGNDIVHLFIQRSPESEGSEVDAETRIREWIRANMAPYKVPKHIHFLDAIPLTPVGKIDKKKMRAMVIA